MNQPELKQSLARATHLLLGFQADNLELEEQGASQERRAQLRVKIEEIRAQQRKLTQFFFN